MPIDPPKPPPPQHGIPCRKCGCTHHRTIETQPTYAGRVRRRRVCRHCGHRFTTIERPA